MNGGGEGGGESRVENPTCIFIHHLSGLAPLPQQLRRFKVAVREFPLGAWRGSWLA